MNRTDMRAAALALLDGYKAANPGDLRQTFPARPMSLHPPSAFVDGIDTGSIDYSSRQVQTNFDVRIRLVRGTFATGDVSESNDELVDGFMEYVLDNLHVAGGATLTLVSSVEDEDGWIPEWMPPDLARPYYSTVVTLTGEGQFAAI